MSHAVYLVDGEAFDDFSGQVFAPQAFSAASLPLMRVAVVTAYHREPVHYLRQCLESVRDQTHPCTHFMVADGHPHDLVGGFNCEHIILPREHSDYGDTPRTIGAVSAMGLGFDAICFLDADNWVDDNHVETLVDLHQATGAAVTSTRRVKCTILGDPMWLDLTPEVQFKDTSSFMLFRGAFRFIGFASQIDPRLHPIGDRLMWKAIVDSGLLRASTETPTLCYREHHCQSYRNAGLTPPEDAREPGPRTLNAIGLARELGYPRIEWRYQRVYPDPGATLRSGPGDAHNH